ncbi:MAG: PEP-CTERM sorting domain-containing protein [Verrucomicrobia bacterium]|nr:PEP-CTERM sorting domain-containing protein [Verrucomicrobiota bacterium]MCH8513492.1 PEP-CTERM sorting domain-containing protein [Kiritimatiellia bacterium]
MKTKSKTTLATLITGLTVFSASIHAQDFVTEWEGADGASINTAGNWSSGLPTDLDDGEWGLIDTGNSLTMADSEGAFNGMRLWLENGTISNDERSARYLMDDFQLRMNGGNFTHGIGTTPGSNKQLILRDGTFLDLVGGTTNFVTAETEGLAFGSGGSGSGEARVDIRGGTHTWGDVQFRQPNEGLNFLPGEYTLTLTNATDPVDLGRDHTNFRFHLGGGSLIMSAFDSTTPYDFEGNLWNAGELTFIDGGGSEFTNANGTFSDYFNVTDGNTLTAIPEPGTLMLLGIAFGTLILFRRRSGR